jgi:hypothetical protein
MLEGALFYVSFVRDIKLAVLTDLAAYLLGKQEGSERVRGVIYPIGSSISETSFSEKN